MPSAKGSAGLTLKKPVKIRKGKTKKRKTIKTN